MLTREPGRTLANGDLLRVEAVPPGGLIVRRALTLARGPDSAAGPGCVALTRGTGVGIACVFTVSPKRADPAPGPRPAPELARYDKIYAERSGVPTPATPPAPAATALGRRVGDGA